MKSKQCLLLLLIAACTVVSPAADAPLSWPPISRTQRPWAFWWWMGSAVDKTNLTHELSRYHDAGMGGVHIIPIYGARGWESNYIAYLSPRWMDMLAFTVGEANRLHLGVDMTTGTGWCFGGPEVTAEEANASVVVKTFEVAAGQRWVEKLDRAKIQALVAFSAGGKPVDLTGKISPDGRVDWTAPPGSWRVYAISQKPSGQKVKRAAPGGEGWMLNPFYAKAMTNYLRWFGRAFANYSGPKPRAQFQDSYEYRSDWSPDFFAQFQKRRGYRLQDELPALFGGDTNTDRVARVKCDYRRTISDLMSQATMPLWVQWSHRHGFMVRYQAHGAPGNLLDLYALADCPETEMFHLDRDKLVSKFASSAAHVAGRKLVSAETGTWLAEHFTGTLGEMKFLVDDMFLSGVNHIVYHGLCYSPDQAGWPGWHFYASFEMNPRNSVWHDVPTLNSYVARAQSILQSGKPDTDVLLYWPVCDYWSSSDGLVRQFTVHARDWLEDQPVGEAAQALWNGGYQFDYVSDHQLDTATVVNGAIRMPGGDYKVVVVPQCRLMPLQTLKQLSALAKAGATIIFEQHLPVDVPGWNDLQGRRRAFEQLTSQLLLLASNRGGRVLIGNLMNQLQRARCAPETLVNRGLSFTRRAFDGGWHYFIANRGDTNFDGWITLARPAKSAVILDPMSGECGVAATRLANDRLQIHLQLEAGQSLILRAFAEQEIQGQPWAYWRSIGAKAEVAGQWQVKFVNGGPVLPSSFETNRLGSWTDCADTNAQRFAGTARYELTFDSPLPGQTTAALDLGQVCQSARVRLNGKDFGTLITPPFCVVVNNLKARGNRLEVQVTNVSANRIRDLDRRGIKWKTFRDINVVNLNYRPFDASNWPLTPSGLLGPVTLTPLAGE